MHIRRDTHGAQNIVALRASPFSIQESTQEIIVVHKLETLGNYPVSFCVTSMYLSAKAIICSSENS